MTPHVLTTSGLTEERERFALFVAGAAMIASEDPLSAPHMSAEDGHAGAVLRLPGTLLKAYAEICEVLGNLRESRDAIRQATVDKLQHTTAKLAEVSSATEVAATGILDGLDRAIVLVDELDSIDQSGDTRGQDVRLRLRDELFQVQSCLQFQDITAQQLNHASSILVEVERRLLGLAQTLDPGASGLPVPEVPQQAPENRAFDPGATLHDADIRQALADSIFRPPG